MKKQPVLEENTFYHIYNRGNNGDNIFYKPENYFYFLKKYDAYLSEFLETYAYCLLPNHFHLLVRIKAYSTFPLQKLSESGLNDETYIPEQAVSKQLRHFFQGYAQAINKQEMRTGSLFQKRFKRKAVTNSTYFTQLIHYIHANPQHHGFTGDFRAYPYSSYGRILLDKPSKLFKQEVLGWFGSKEEYILFHSQNQRYKDVSKFSIEED